MPFVRLPDVHQGQHHKDKGLQHHDQDMKNGPAEAGQKVQTSAPAGRRGAEEGNEQKNQLAGKHVAKESHRHGDRLGGVFDQVEQQIERRQQRMSTKWSAEEFVDPATEMLDLDPVINRRDQNHQRHRQRAVQVSRWNDAVVVNSVIQPSGAQ